MIGQHHVLPKLLPQVWLAILLLMPIGLVGFMMMGNSVPPDAFLAFIEASEAQSAGNPALASVLREQGQQIIAQEEARERLIAVGLAVISAILIGCIWIQKRQTIHK